jgi:cytosine permease
MSNIEKKKFNEAEDPEFSLSAVPSKHQSQGLWSAMVVLVGFTFFTPSMTAGGNLGIGLNLESFLLAVFIGNVFLGLYCGILGYIGQKTALSLDMLARHSFGEIGSYLPSAIISFTQIGWFGVGVAMFAIPVSSLTHVPIWILIVVTGCVMTLTAYYGIKALAILGSIAVPLIAILGVYSVNWGINEVGGFMNIFADKPEKPLTLAAGIGIVVGSFISGGTATPNFSRFARTPKTAVIATVLAFFIGNSIMMIFGAVGGAVTGVPDIFDILILQGLAIPAVVTLGLNIWTTNNNALYTAGLGVSNITKVPMKPLVLVAGTVGTVTAVWLYYNFVSYLSLLSGLIPPVGVVLIIHYYMNRREYADVKHKYVKLRIGSISAVLCGALVGIFVPWGIAPVNALIVAAIICLISEKITRSKAAA